MLLMLFIKCTCTYHRSDVNTRSVKFFILFLQINDTVDFRRERNQLSFVAAQLPQTEHVRMGRQFGEVFQYRLTEIPRIIVALLELDVSLDERAF